MPGDKSIEAEKKRLRQEATRLRLKRQMEGKNPMSGTVDKPKPVETPKEKTLIERIQDFFGLSALKKAGGQ